MTKQKVIHEAIEAERQRQEILWGQQDHTPVGWLAILAEEFGEVAKVVNEGVSSNYDAVTEYVVELTQVAAVAVAMIESVRRNGWQ